MHALRQVATYLVTAAFFLAVDLLWLGLLARSLYRRYLGPFLADEVNGVAALAFYLFFPLGVLFFSVRPARERASGRHALLTGGLFGLFAYATYELTNLATLEGWPLEIVLVDVAWGAVLTGATGWVGYRVLRWMQGTLGSPPGSEER